ncbi:hypothetical protein WKW80_29680 [Variovorax humicola]|uniref:Uncharacterized protein n=1 Tax=Variovorax humicola TaxID=1769758 RepID=A0ABU8W812_9BURK
MAYAASFFRTSLLAAIALPFFFAALSGNPGFVDPLPVEGSPAYLAIERVHDAFSLDDTDTAAGDDSSGTDEALANIVQANQIVAPTFYF